MKTTLVVVLKVDLLIRMQLALAVVFKVDLLIQVALAEEFEVDLFIPKALFHRKNRLQIQTLDLLVVKENVFLFYVLFLWGFALG